MGHKCVHFLEEVPVDDEQQLLQHEVDPPGDKLVSVLLQLLLVQAEVALAESRHQPLVLDELVALEQARLQHDSRAQITSRRGISGAYARGHRQPRAYPRQAIEVELDGDVVGQDGATVVHGVDVTVLECVVEVALCLLVVRLQKPQPTTEKMVRHSVRLTPGANPTSEPYNRGKELLSCLHAHACPQALSLCKTAHPL